MSVEAYTAKFNRVIYNDGLSQVHFNTKTQTLALFDLHLNPISIIGLTPMSLRHLAMHFLNAAHEIEEDWK
jgi:hypothetical protein